MTWTKSQVMNNAAWSPLDPQTQAKTLWFFSMESFFFHECKNISHTQSDSKVSIHKNHRITHARFIPRWKYRFSSDQRSQAPLGNVSTGVGDQPGTHCDLAFFSLVVSIFFSCTSHRRGVWNSVVVNPQMISTLLSRIFHKLSDVVVSFTYNVIHTHMSQYFGSKNN